MAVQKKVLTEGRDGSLQPVRGGAAKTLSGSAGVLSNGKAGDVVESSYGPVVKVGFVTAETAFGTFVPGLGILVNPDDCAGIASGGFDTKTLKAGQVGTFLTSGAAIVPCSELTSIRNWMRVMAVDGETAVAGDICAVEVNGFKLNFNIPTRARVSTALAAVDPATGTLTDAIAALGGLIPSAAVSTLVELCLATGAPTSISTIQEYLAYFQ